MLGSTLEGHELEEVGGGGGVQVSKKAELNRGLKNYAEMDVRQARSLDIDVSKIQSHSKHSGMF